MPTMLRQFRVIARIYDSGELCGYRLQPAHANQGQYLDVSTEDFKQAVRDKAILNCTISGEDVSGINGFKLRELPKISLSARQLTVQARLNLGGQRVIGYVFKNESMEHLNIGEKYFGPGEYFALSNFDLQSCSELIYGYDVESFNGKNEIGNCRLVPISGYAGTIQNEINITAYNPDNNTYYVRLPYLYSQSIKQYLDKLSAGTGLNIVMKYRPSRGFEESNIIKREIEEFNRSMRLCRNTLHAAMEDNGADDETSIIEPIEDRRRFKFRDFLNKLSK